jgi:autotransporter-associated beta strand protein
LTKIGEGTLTVSKANSYNGPTRVLGGTIAFTDASGFPGGDIEVAADMLAVRSASSACITVPGLSFNSGAKIRLLVPRGFDIKKYRRWKTVVTSAAAIGGALPSAEVVDAETGEVLHYEVRLSVSENGCSLLAKPVMGLVITVF